MNQSFSIHAKRLWPFLSNDVSHLHHWQKGFESRSACCWRLHQRANALPLEATLVSLTESAAEFCSVERLMKADRRLQAAGHIVKNVAAGHLVTLWRAALNLLH
jgi:hypothetical protein